MPKNAVDTSFLVDLINSQRSRIDENTELADIVTFAEAPWGLQMKLLPMQKFLLKMFYGLPLENSGKYIPIWDDTQTKLLGTLTEQECLDFLISERRTNLTEYKPGQQRKELVLVGGRRGSKSTITSVIADYEANRLLRMKDPQAHFGHPKGQEICITTIATTERQSKTLYDMIRAKALACPYLKDRMRTSSDMEFSFATETDDEYGFKPSIVVQCGSPLGGTLRSSNNLIVVMDEAAFFPVTGKSSGESVYSAFTPTISTFKGEGKIILLSSPFSKSGLFWNRYCESFNNPDSILMFQFYSALMNPNQDPELLTMAKKQDKVKFGCEYGGMFSDTVCAWIEKDSLASCVKDPRTTNLPRGEKGQVYYMGIDYGGKNDGSAVAIVHKEDDDIVLDYADVFYCKKSDVWKSTSNAYSQASAVFGDQDVIYPSMLADVIKKLCDQFDVIGGWFDQYNGLGLYELLRERHVSSLEMKALSASLNLQMYQTLKSLINVGKVRLFNHPVLIPELETLEERRDKSLAVVEAPQREGFHDDISDAFAIAVYSAYNSKKGGGRVKTIGVAGTRGMGVSDASYKVHRFKKFKLHGGEYYRNFRSGM
ncbi:MAG: hypothetical protein J6Y62_00465 [Clostridia bacterium]|nr:hypothetical protein [Clostridia bacterium]